MSAAKDGAKRDLKKRHLGLAGLITVLMQYGIGAKNEDTTQKAFQSVVQEQLKTQRAELGERLERDFVRKAELAPTLRRMEKKLDRADEKLETMSTKVSKIEGMMKRNRTWGALERSENLTLR